MLQPAEPVALPWFAVVVLMPGRKTRREGREQRVSARSRNEGGKSDRTKQNIRNWTWEMQDVTPEDSMDCWN